MPLKKVRFGSKAKAIYPTHNILCYLYFCFSSFNWCCSCIGKAETGKVVTAIQLAPRLAPTPSYHQCLPKKRYPATRKKKTVFTDYQMELLEMTFSSTQYPSSVLRQQLSYISGISPQTLLV